MAVGIGVFLVLSSKPGTDGEGSGFSLREFLPFGSSGEGNPGGAEVVIDDKQPNNNTLTNNQVGQVPRLRKLSKEPVAGSVIFNIGTTSIVRFVEKGTGNVYEANSETNTITRLTNTTLPKIIRAFWLPAGSGFLAQTLLPDSEIIETTFVKLEKNTATTSANEVLTPYKTTLSQLPTGIVELSINPAGTKVFYYTKQGGISQWFIANLDGTSETLLTSHSITEFIPRWFATNSILIQTKASAESLGYTYLFNPTNKSVQKIGAGEYGLIANPKADGLLTLESRGGANPELLLLDNKSFDTTPIQTLTMADKCVWLTEKSPSVYCAVPAGLPTGNYPDIWYQGRVFTEDNFIKIDLTNDIYYNLSYLKNEAGESIDVVDPSIVKDESHLTFRNKKDGFLWMLRVEQ